MALRMGESSLSINVSCPKDISDVLHSRLIHPRTGDYVLSRGVRAAMEVASERASQKETTMSWLLRKSVLGLVVGLSLVTPLASAAQRPREGRMAAAKFSLPTPSEMFVGAWSFLV